MNPDLARLRRYFDEARDLTEQARQESLRDIDYYDGIQWTREEKAALAKRGQPDIVINRTRAAVNGILGVVERGRSDPRAYPRTPKDEDSADLATDVLRYIGDFNRLHHLKMQCFRDMLVPGTMAAIVEVDGESQVTIEQIRWEEFFADPRSRRTDFKDARYMGVAKWMYEDDVLALYPDAKEGLTATFADGAVDVSYQDRPSNTTWIDRRQRRLLMVEVYYREGGWKRCVYHCGQVLEAGDSPYLDAKGQPTCPIEACSAYVDRENNRYGAVRDMRGPQDEINKRRSKLLHRLSTSQIQAVDPSAVEVDANTARAEAARPDGVIPFGWQKVPDMGAAAGEAQLLQEAKGELERLGPNPAVVGREANGASGRALQARTQAGMIELALLFGALEDWELRIWRQCWARARQFWREPMWIRVTDDEDAPKYVQINEPVTDPMFGQVLGYRNGIAELDVDIVLDSQPDTANIQQEQFADLVQLAGNPAYAQQVPFEVLLELSAVPHKRSLIEKIKGHRDQQAQQQMQMAQQQAQIAQAGAVAEIEKTQSETALNSAKAQTELFNAQVKADQAYIGALKPAAGDTGAEAA